ncbi:hypothetical protein FA15DRAFT_683479 [Coprinopsis marcescibilis]|uniref:Uncharacterized protein n=1 Tax=Coprinopsis marcescibilis TaxID=230819 RepID=A0A5C3KCS8_COPMA|nr:hypothetical protein FA15DRAFT_683479 [Coprinopsis marcescibilis]
MPGRQTYQPHNELQQDQSSLKHYFGPKHYYCVETICYRYGVVKAWAKFAKSESPKKILKFLAAVFPTKEERLDFICINKACLVLQTAISNGSQNEWKKTSQFIVDIYHYNNHKESDELCHKWLCEQLNAWLGEFAAILKQMTANNFNWMIHIMLYYHTQIEEDNEDEQEEEE